MGRDRRRGELRELECFCPTKSLQLIGLKLLLRTLRVLSSEHVKLEPGSLFACPWGCSRSFPSCFGDKRDDVTLDLGHGSPRYSHRSDLQHPRPLLHTPMLESCICHIR